MTASSRRITQRSLLVGVLLTAGLAPGGTAGAASPTPTPAEPRPFDRGSVNLGLAMGLSVGEATAFSIGGSFGYFVLPGLEPGLLADVTFGSVQPTVVALLPYLRWVAWRSYIVSPFVKVQGGRLFVIDQADLSAVGGGAGLVYFLNRHVGVQLEGVVLRYFPEQACGASCTDFSFGFTFGIYLGGASRAAPPPPQIAPPPPPPPPPPPTPEPAPEPEPEPERETPPEEPRDEPLPG